MFLCKQESLDTADIVNENKSEWYPRATVERGRTCLNAPVSTMLCGQYDSTEF